MTEWPWVGENNPFYGKHHSAETRKRISSSLRVSITADRKRKLSESRMGEHNPNYGNEYTEQARKRISESQKGKTNSFYGKHHTEETRKRMRESLIQHPPKTKDTKIEVLLQDALRKRNVVFRTHEPMLGHPDLFIEPNICVFADGDYWHNYPDGKEKDREVTGKLETDGYVVYRFWEHEIKSDLAMCIDKITRGISE